MAQVDVENLGRKWRWGTAQPTTGTWVAGDIVWNTAPASPAPVGWVCTVSGTGGPAQWRSFGA